MPARQRIRRQRGQVALLAVVGLVILAIGMYTTYNLSRAVYEKIKLQNAADAAAYSLATLEARTFNFFAFTNRAQVANYVQMLEMQSLLSSATYVEGAAGWAADVILSAADFIRTWLRWCSPCVSLAETLETLGRMAEGIYRAANLIVDLLDRYVPLYIKAKTSTNDALFAVATMHAVATTTQLADGASDIIAENDPGAEQHPATWVLRGYNTASYLWAFDHASWGLSSGTGADNDKARRVMTEIVNATRQHTGAFDDSFLVARQPFELLSMLGGLGSVDGPRPLANIINILGDAIAIVGAPDFKGTAKLMDAQADIAETLADTKNTAPGRSDLSLGSTLVAKDQPGIGWFGELAAVSSGESGFHCRWKQEKREGGYGRWQNLSSIFNSSASFACDETEEQQRHRWETLIPSIPGGIQPYMKFASHREGLSTEPRSFNQPDVWVWLWKRPEGMELGGDQDLDFTIERGSQRADLDARIGQGGAINTGLLPGMHAVARAQVYYHRPGAWHEPPNFFNPYWGARLAPKGVAFERLSAILPSELADFIADNIWMH